MMPVAFSGLIEGDGFVATPAGGGLKRIYILNRKTTVECISQVTMATCPVLQGR